MQQLLEAMRTQVLVGKYKKTAHVVPAQAVVRRKLLSNVFYKSKPSLWALNVAWLVERLPGVCKALALNAVST